MHIHPAWKLSSWNLQSALFHAAFFGSQLLHFPKLQITKLRWIKNIYIFEIQGRILFIVKNRQNVKLPLCEILKILFSHTSSAMFQFILKDASYFCCLHDIPFSSLTIKSKFTLRGILYKSHWRVLMCFNYTKRYVISYHKTFM